MQYTGGKSRIAKELASLISSFKPNVYWEPFAGAANVIQEVNAPIRIGSDCDPHVINYLREVQKGWLPPSEVSKNDYDFWKKFIPTTPREYAIKGAIGYGTSFGGRFFEGYGYDSKSNIGCIRRSAKKQFPKLRGIEFKVSSFEESIPKETDLIYCDPPYANTKRVGTQREFDSNFFWSWALACSISGIRVLVSEFEAPAFACEIWSKSIVRGLRPSKKDRIMIERLFLLEPKG